MPSAIWMIDLDELVEAVLGVGRIAFQFEDLIGCGQDVRDP